MDKTFDNVLWQAYKAGHDLACDLPWCDEETTIRRNFDSWRENHLAKLHLIGVGSRGQR